VDAGWDCRLIERAHVLPQLVQRWPHVAARADVVAQAGLRELEKVRQRPPLRRRAGRQVKRLLGSKQAQKQVIEIAGQPAVPDADCVRPFDLRPLSSRELVREKWEVDA